MRQIPPLLSAAFLLATAACRVETESNLDFYARETDQNGVERARIVWYHMFQEKRGAPITMCWYTTKGENGDVSPTVSDLAAIGKSKAARDQVIQAIKNSSLISRKNQLATEYKNAFRDSKELKKIEIDSSTATESHQLLGGFFGTLLQGAVQGGMDFLNGGGKGGSFFGSILGGAGKSLLGMFGGGGDKKGGGIGGSGNGFGGLLGGLGKIFGGGGGGGGQGFQPFSAGNLHLSEAKTAEEVVGPEISLEAIIALESVARATGDSSKLAEDCQEANSLVVK